MRRLVLEKRWRNFEQYTVDLVLKRLQQDMGSRLTWTLIHVKHLIQVEVSAPNVDICMLFANSVCSSATPSLQLPSPNRNAMAYPGFPTILYCGGDFTFLIWILATFTLHNKFCIW